MLSSPVSFLHVSTFTPTCFDQPELPAFALDTINFGSASSRAYQCAMFDCQSVSVEILALGLGCMKGKTQHQVIHNNKREMNTHAPRSVSGPDLWLAHNYSEQGKRHHASIPDRNLPH